MIVQRWQAPRPLSKKQATLILEAEGLEAFEETFTPNMSIKDHRHPFDEIRFVIEGELMMDVNGNKLLLRSGDRILIPANTKHNKKYEGSETCLCIVAHRP